MNTSAGKGHFIAERDYWGTIKKLRRSSSSYKAAKIVCLVSKTCSTEEEQEETQLEEDNYDNLRATMKALT